MLFFRQQRGQAGIEYLMVVGAVVVAMVIALTIVPAALIPHIAGLLCTSVDPAGSGSCLVP